jgi:hypothetical protein
MDGRKIKSIRHIQGEKLITEQRDRSTGKLQLTIETTLSAEGKMVEKCTCNNVVAYRTYKRIE